VARIAAGDVDDLAAQPDLLDVCQEDDLHRLARDVGQQGHLARALDSDSDLALVSPAGAGDPPRADLALLRDVAAELVDVLVVDVVDLLAAEVAVALPGLAVAKPGPLAAASPLLSLRRR